MAMAMAAERKTVRRPGRVLSARWDNKDVFTISETATILGLSVATTYTAVRAGDIPCSRIRNRWIISRFTIEALLAA
jgi:excisionase family DNA binding protein